MASRFCTVAIPAAQRYAGPSRRALPTSVVLVALAVVALNLFDVLSTLAHIERGAVELNPLMQQLLAEGPLAFTLAKHFLVGAGVVLFAGHCGSRLSLGALRFVVLPTYSMLAIYQVVLFAFIN